MFIRRQGLGAKLKPFEKFVVVKSENAHHVLRVRLLYFPPWWVKLEAMNVPRATGRPSDNVKVPTVSCFPSVLLNIACMTLLIQKRKTLCTKVWKICRCLCKKEERDLLVRGSCFSQYKLVLKQTFSCTNCLLFRTKC